MSEKRATHEVVRRGYTDEELGHLYELARFHLENGDLRKAETVAAGLNEVAPEFSPAWLLTCCVQVAGKNYEGALHSARQALRADQDSLEAMLFLTSALLTTEDFNTAGSYLGEIGERIEKGEVQNPDVLRFYRAQLVRYQGR